MVPWALKRKKNRPEVAEVVQLKAPVALIPRKKLPGVAEAVKHRTVVRFFSLEQDRCCSGGIGLCLLLLYTMLT